MYLAIKWLVFITLAMWIALCGLELDILRKKAISCSDLSSTGSSAHSYDKNISISGRKPPQFNKNIPYMFVSRTVHKKYGSSSSSLLHYLAFAAGALVVTVYNRRNEILNAVSGLLSSLRSKYRKLTKRLSKKRFELDLNQTVAWIWTWVAIQENRSKLRQILKDALQENSPKLWQNLKDVMQEKKSKLWRTLRNIYAIIKKIYSKFKFENDPNKEEDNDKLSLLSKIKELGDEHKNLSQLLMAAIQENKNIRLEYKLESMAKNRLIHHLEEIDKQAKVYRSRYIELKQHHVETQEENLYLKVRAQKLSSEKEAVVSNLMTLLKEIHNTSDQNLKAICFDIIHGSKHSVDGNGDPGEFCLKQLPSAASTGIDTPRSLGKYLDTGQSIDSDISGLPYKGEEPIPKLSGLSGEYAWTIKDNKNGTIEKLYEYDYGYTSDKGNLRLYGREYMVYHDNKVLLEFIKSSAACRVPSVHMKRVSEQSLAPPSQEHMVPVQPTVEITTNSGTSNVELVECTWSMSVYARCQIRTREFPTTQRFLTGSAAFQSFLRNNTSIVTPSKPAQRCINALY